MKNKLSILIIVAIGLSLVLGCGISQRIKEATGVDSKTDKSANSKSAPADDSLTDKTIDAVADGETTGVAECDEVIALIDAQIDDKDAGWMEKAAKGYALGFFKKAIKESVEKNKNDQTKLARECTDMKKQVEKALADAKAKGKE
jgi:hypothetical protein